MIGYFKIGYERLAEFFYFNVFAVVLAYRNAVINDVGNNHHYFFDFLFEFSFEGFHFGEFVAEFSNFCLSLFSLIFKTLSHKTADFLASHLADVSEAVTFCFSFPEFFIEFKNLVNEFNFLVLKFFSYIFLDEFGICPY